MKILVSACLLGIDCKYNGKNNKNDKIIELLKDHELIPVCPEIMGGLPTPRIPAEIHQNKVIAKDGKEIEIKEPKIIKNRKSFEFTYFVCNLMLLLTIGQIFQTPWSL